MVFVNILSFHWSEEMALFLVTGTHHMVIYVQTAVTQVRGQMFSSPLLCNTVAVHGFGCELGAVILEDNFWKFSTVPPYGKEF